MLSYNFHFFGALVSCRINFESLYSRGKARNTVKEIFLHFYFLPTGVQYIFKIVSKDCICMRLHKCKAKKWKYASPLPTKTTTDLHFVN